MNFTNFRTHKFHLTFNSWISLGFKTQQNNGSITTKWAKCYTYWTSTTKNRKGKLLHPPIHDCSRFLDSRENEYVELQLITLLCRKWNLYVFPISKTVRECLPFHHGVEDDEHQNQPLRVETNRPSEERYDFLIDLTGYKGHNCFAQLKLSQDFWCHAAQIRGRNSDTEREQGTVIP